jgi:hypothetical protein
MKATLAAVGLSVLLFSGPAGAAATRVTGVALLDLHSVQVFNYGVPLGVLYAARDWTVTDDGTTASIVRLRPVAAAAQPSVVMKQLVANHQALADLSAALIAGKAGAVQGACNLGGPPPPAGQFYRYEVTWYGLRGRIHRFSIANDFPDACPPEVSTLLDAILFFEQRVIDEPLPVWTPVP